MKVPQVDWQHATEAELRDAKEPWPKTEQELIDFIRVMATRTHDYGTCVYAMSLSATATFNYMSGVLGCTGFQAGCADLDILRHTRDLKRGKILNYNDLLYPQYADKWETWEETLDRNIDWLGIEAAILIAQHEANPAHPDVAAHWNRRTCGLG